MVVVVGATVGLPLVVEGVATRPATARAALLAAARRTTHPLATAAAAGVGVATAAAAAAGDPTLAATKTHPPGGVESEHPNMTLDFFKISNVALGVLKILIALAVISQNVGSGG